MKIAVLGGGHGGYAAAADLTLRGYEVCLFTFSAARVETLHNNDNVISYTGVWGEGSCRVAHVSNSMEEAVSGADLVVMNVPGTGHERYLNAMKPYLRGDTVLYMNPGHTGGALRAAHILGRGRIAEANTLSYIARKTSETSVHVSSSDKPVTVGVFPAKDTEAVLEVIRKAYPYVVAGRDVLESSLCNINAMFHPPGVVLNAGWIEHTGGDFRFYYDGVTPAIGKVIPTRPARRAKPTSSSKRPPRSTTGTCTRISAPAFSRSRSWAVWPASPRRSRMRTSPCPRP